MKKVSKSTKILISILLILCIIAIAFGIKNVNKQKSNNSNYNTLLTSETENSNEKTQTNSTSEATQTETTSSVESNQEDFSNELFAQYYKQAEQIMKDMTIEEKVGQIFLVRYPDNGVINQIKNEYLYKILFSLFKDKIIKNFKNKLFSLPFFAEIFILSLK